jgi:squalene-hopene/tetraprenyl-beta-curcumene cyclase
MTAPVPAQARAGAAVAASGEIRRAVEKARDCLFAQQHPDGYWCGELEADAMLEADYLFLHTLLGDGEPGRMARAFTEMLRVQNADGSWSIFPGGPGDISLSVKCYSSAKLMGLKADDPRLARCREWVLAHGGVTAVNTFTKMYLCALGEYDYDAAPAIPPEIVLFPRWFYFNIYEISSWSRSILVPLAVIYAKKPFKKIPPERGIDELFVGGRANAILRLRHDRSKLFSWRNFFIGLDRLMHWAEAVHIRPVRALALRKAEAWILERLDMADGLGAIYPAMLNAIIALKCLGYPDDDPRLLRAKAEFEKLGIEAPPGKDCPEATFRMQPCVSPVWDTAQALTALGAAGVPADDPRMAKAAQWLLAKEVRVLGDWAVKVPGVEPGGWYFEFQNDHYPDTDDSAQVILALGAARSGNPARQAGAVRRALDWELAMQCADGGWGSFDKDNTKMIFQFIPFADHNAMLDPPTADITGRMLEMLAAQGHRRGEPHVEKAISFLLKEQEPDGSWFGRWGVNYIYGTFLALRGLDRIGWGRATPEMRRGAAWLKAHQNADGGWGETCASYDDPSLRGRGVSTPSQTAWALLGLHAAGEERSPEAHKGVRWLIERQRADGGWDETMGADAAHQSVITGTGFPRVFYLAYGMYRLYFPLLALSDYAGVHTPARFP